jgi:hypothetical protein
MKYSNDFPKFVQEAKNYHLPRDHDFIKVQNLYDTNFDAPDAHFDKLCLFNDIQCSVDMLLKELYLYSVKYVFSLQ